MKTSAIIKENVVFFADAEKALPESPCFHTVQTWAMHGRKGTDGMRHTIEWCKLPRGRATSIEAYYRFIQRLNGELAPLAEDVRRNEQRQKGGKPSA